MTKDPSTISSKHSEVWTVDELFQYLTRIACWPAGEAIGEMQEKFARDRLPLHWRRTDPGGVNQEGTIPGISFRSGSLCVDRDFYSEHRVIELATGKFTAKNDGRVFIRLLESSAPATYELTVPAWLARQLWPPRLASEAPVAAAVEPVQPPSEQQPILKPPGHLPAESVPSDSNVIDHQLADDAEINDLAEISDLPGRGTISDDTTVTEHLREEASREPRTETTVRSLKRRIHHRPQQAEARKVLKVIWPNGNPTQDELSHLDLWETFKSKYNQMIEAGQLKKSSLGMPSKTSVLREVGRRG